MSLPRDFYVTRSNIPGQGNRKFYLGIIEDKAFWFSGTYSATQFSKQHAMEEIEKRKAIHNLDLYEIEAAQ